MFCKEAIRRLLVLQLVCFVTSQLLIANGDNPQRGHQDRPIPLGVSGGNQFDRDGAFCCGGTLGGLVQDEDGKLYILSNNHVIARSNRAEIGDPIVQPGLIDVACRQHQDQVVAHLSDYVPIDFDGVNTVDAALALALDGGVKEDGEILEIGPLAPDIVEAALDMTVQKMGRTTGLTEGQVAALDVTVVIRYPNRCGGGGGPRATFVNQVRVTPGDFSAGGDSGSVVVEVPENGSGKPRAVGLLFAGSSTSTLLNPMDEVLRAFNVSMVGGEPLPPENGGEAADPEENGPDVEGDARVQCVHYSTTGGRDGLRHLDVRLEIVDGEAGAGLPGAAVTAEVFLNGSLYQTVGGTTDSGGNLSFRLGNSPNGRYSTKVVSINGDENVETPDNTFEKGDLSGEGQSSFCSGSSSSALFPWRARGLNEVVPVKRRHERGLFALSDKVVGVGVGRSWGGAVIEVYLAVDEAALKARIPQRLENVPVRVVVTGPFEAF